MPIRQQGEPLYDFPCSYTFRAYEALMDEGIELPSIELPEEVKVPLPISPPSNQQNEMSQLKAQMLYIQNKINEHIDQSKKRKKAGTY